MIKLMGLLWTPLQHLFWLIFLRDITKRGGLEITIMEGYFILKGYVDDIFPVFEAKDHTVSF